VVSMVWHLCVCATLASPLPEVLIKKAPPLPAPAGRAVTVADVPSLARAVREAQDGDTILVQPGTYRLDSLLRLDGVRDVTIRGATDDPADAVLLGKGFEVVDDQDDILRIGHCERTTIASLTFEDCHSYGIKVEGENEPSDTRITNCRFRNIGMRAIKGSASETCTVRGGSVVYCDFANDKIPGADWLFEGDYIAGIDMMALDGWTFADNVFRDIRGRNGGGRAAIFLWVRSRHVVVERNLIIGCDRGIAFGNPSMSTASAAGEVHMTNAICRNNAILPGPDAGIELAWVRGARVLNNTIWRADSGGRGIRCIAPVTETLIANNLVRGAFEFTPAVIAEGNVQGELADIFLAPDSGDLRLTRSSGAGNGVEASCGAGWGVIVASSCSQ